MHPVRLFCLSLFVSFAGMEAMAQNAFNCPSFAATGACSAATSGHAANFLNRNGAGLSGSAINMIPANSGHNGYGLWYVNPQNVQAFSTTFSFIPNGQNIAFVIQNSTTNPGYTGNIFSSGAGCEGGFYQAFGTAPNYVFALEFDSGSWLTPANPAFTYSSVQIYQTGQSPCLPNDSGPNYVPKNKLSTYPVPLNYPANAQYTTTGDLYSATVTYDGSTVSLSLYDVTAGGACPGSTCFTQSWSGVNIPSIVAGTTAYVGFTGGINIPNLPALWVDSWSFTSGRHAQAVTAAPTFLPAAGTYPAAQSVTLFESTPGATIYYTTDGTAPTTSSTQYTGPITVNSTETLTAMGAAPGDANSAVAAASYAIVAPSVQYSCPLNATVLVTATPGATGVVLSGAAALPVITCTRVAQ